MAKPGSVIGWKLDREQREILLLRFKPLYADAVADHVTLATDTEDQALPPPVRARIVGHADDGDSLEAMVVEIDGSSDRPDGSTFHITWSLDKASGRRARESNDMLKEGWTRFDEPIALRVEPARF